MSPCPRCGSPPEPGAPFCGVCGAQLATAPPLQAPAAPAPQPAPAFAKQTMLGMSPQAAPPAAPARPQAMLQTMIGTGVPTPSPYGHAQHAVAPAAQSGATAPAPGMQRPPSTQPPPAMQQTMLGVASPLAAPPQPHAAPGYARPDPKQTMLGMASPLAAPPQPSPAALPAPQAPAGRAALAAAKRTVMGVAVPGIAPLAPGAPASASPSARAGAGGMKRTMMGVAVPGIAPLQPGMAPPAAESPWSVPGGYADDPSHDPHAQPDVAPRKRERSRRAAPPSKGHKSPAILAIAGAGALALGAIVFALVWRSPAPLVLEPRADASGADLLHVTCGSCPEGTTLTVAGSKATVAQGAADLPLATPLAVGDNHLVVGIDRPGNGRDEQVPVIVPVAFRVRPELELLASDRPSIRIAVEAAAGASATIDGKAVALSADGKGSYAIDVSAETTGLADEPRTIERQVPYSITPRAGVASSGQVTVRVGVVPLHLDAPGSRGTTESASLWFAGRTAKGASVTVAGKPAAVAKDGTFALAMALPGVGDSDVDVRASAPGQASRSARVHVRRVASLAAEARELGAKAKLSFDELAADVQRHVGEPVVVEGEVIDLRAQSHQTVVLIDTKGCTRPPCVTRVVHGGDDAFTRGDRVRAFGRVSRAFTVAGADGTTASSSQVPEIEADFLLKAR